MDKCLTCKHQPNSEHNFCTKCGTVHSEAVTNTNINKLIKDAVNVELQKLKVLETSKNTKTVISNIVGKTAMQIKPKSTPYRVIIADDSMFITKQLGVLLSLEGFLVAGTASDGAQWVARYKELYPNINLVTMDMTMPVMDELLLMKKSSNLTEMLELSWSVLIVRKICLINVCVWVQKVTS